MTPSADHLREIDAAIRLVDRELWVITAAHAGRRGGLLASWVSSASIDPERPVLLAGVAPNHFTAELVQESKTFAAHLLRADQVAVAWNFASGSGRNFDKLAQLATATGQTGVPLLADCLASFECRVLARYDAGDRLFFWGDVIQCRTSNSDTRGEHPLREHAFFQSLTSEQQTILTADRQADARQNRPLHERWRATNPW